MESKKVLLLLLVAMVLLVNVVIVAAFTNQEVDTNEGPKLKISTPESEDEAVSHQQVKSRFLSQGFYFPSIPNYQTITGSTTCDKSSNICSTNGSTRPDCCQKRCVNTQTNVLNCGTCGNKCYYTELCCSGKCVDIFQNNDHCGRCNSQCKGTQCSYGMCNYA